MFARCSKKVPTITNVHYKSVRYTEVFLWEFDRELVGSLKKCPLLPGVRYNRIFDQQKSTLEIAFSFAWQQLLCLLETII